MLLSSHDQSVLHPVVSPVSIGDGELVLRLGMAVLLCATIGIERSARDEVAGMRTHALVGLGAALFTLLSAYGFAGVASTTVARPDPTRIAAQIVSGIGFLGAGAIIREGLTVRGITTASSLWIAAAIGMAAGAGFYLGAVVTTALVLLVLILLRRVRTAIMPAIRAGFVLLDVELTGDGESAAVLAILAAHRVGIESLRSTLEPEGERLQLELRLPPRMDFSAVLADLRALTGVAGASCSALRP
jgi:putative Mg2+ transporter-C (MgtC) family protein